MRDLHQDAGAVAGARIGTHSATMFQIAENVERVRNDLMRLLALDIGDEADAAGILFQRDVVEAFGGGPPGMLTKIMLTNGGLRHTGLEHAARIASRFASRGRRQRIRHDLFALELRPAHFKSSYG